MVDTTVRGLSDIKIWEYGEWKLDLKERGRSRERLSLTALLQETRKVQEADVNVTLIFSTVPAGPSLWSPGS